MHVRAVGPFRDARGLGQVRPTRHAPVDWFYLVGMDLSTLIESLHRDLGIVREQQTHFLGPGHPLEIPAHNRQHVARVRSL